MARSCIGLHKLLIGRQFGVVSANDIVQEATTDEASRHHNKDKWASIITVFLAQLVVSWSINVSPPHNLKTTEPRVTEEVPRIVVVKEQADSKTLSGLKLCFLRYVLPLPLRDYF